MKDTWLGILAPSVGEYRDKGSKFIAHAFPAHTQGEISTHIERTKKEHPTARHHCYAWRLGLNQNHFRANDDGEPSGASSAPQK